MPELPEVETLRRALIPIIQNRRLVELIFYRLDLRFTIPKKALTQHIQNQIINEIVRLGKYLLFHVSDGAMLWHLGMSGRVIQLPTQEPIQPHTHAVFRLETDTYLHFVDPRRFGCILWVPKGEKHPLLDHLGPDPFSKDACPKVMKARAQRCNGSIKNFLMNGRRLAGIGNIYACEALFEVRMNPNRPAYRLSLQSWSKLLNVIRKILRKSIESGGTTLRDFYGLKGDTGYFALQLSVYGKEGKPCVFCKTPIRRKVHTARSTYYCPSCQKY